MKIKLPVDRKDIKVSFGDNKLKSSNITQCQCLYDVFLNSNLCTCDSFCYISTQEYFEKTYREILLEILLLDYERLQDSLGLMTGDVCSAKDGRYLPPLGLNVDGPILPGGARTTVTGPTPFVPRNQQGNKDLSPVVIYWLYICM